MKRKVTPKRRETSGFSLWCLGTVPERKSVFLAPSGGMGSQSQASLYRSVLEASLNGYDIIHVPGQDYDGIVEKAVYASEKGRLYLVLPRGIGTASHATISMALVTGGGILSLEDYNTVFSLERLNKAKTLGSTLGAITIYADEKARTVPPFVTDALDAGGEILVLDTALKGRGARTLMMEGAYVAASFSFALGNARYHVVPDEEGKYCFLGYRFAIMDTYG